SSSYHSHHVIIYKHSQIAFSTCAGNPPPRYIFFGYIYTDGILSPKLAPIDENDFYLSGVQLSLPSTYSNFSRRQFKELVAAISIMVNRKHEPAGFKVPREELLKRIDSVFDSRVISERIKNSLISDTDGQIEIPSTAMYILRLEATE